MLPKMKPGTFLRGSLSPWKIRIFALVVSLAFFIVSIPYFLIWEHRLKSMLFECRGPSFRETVGPMLSLNTSHLSSDMVPNFVHYNWFSNVSKEFKFHQLLSLLSAHRIMKADKIFFHHNMEPHGQYWDEAIREIPNLVLVRRAPPTCVFGSRLSFPTYQTTSSNVDRILLLLEFGGVYLDHDMLVTRSLEPLRKYKTTLGFESSNFKGARVCGAFIMAAPHSPFMFLWANSLLDDYWVEKWAYITGELSSKLVARFIDTGIVHIEPTALHRPNYFELKKLIGPDPYDWRKNYAVHLWYRKWEEKDKHQSPETIKKRKGTFGEIARMIYYGSTEML